MKLVIKCIFSFVGLIMALYSCTKPTGEGVGTQDPTETPVEFVEYLFALEDGNLYKESDVLGGFVIGAESALPFVSEVIIPEDGAALPLKIDGPNGLSAGDAVVVYSPYVQLEEQQSPSAQPMSIPPVQQQVGTFFDACLFPTVSTPFIVEDGIASGRKEFAGTIQMNPLYSVARIDICVMQPSFEGQKIEYVSFASNGIVGDFQYDLTSDKLDLPSLDSNVVKTDVSELAISSVGQMTSVYMAVAPGIYSGTLTIKTDAVELTVPVEEVVFERACTTPVEVFVQGDIIGGTEVFNPFEGFDWLD